jgi:ABC-type uncharacterized transport system substrate-binding protein
VPQLQDSPSSETDEDIGRKSATYVDRILRGAKPADLPVEQVSTWRLVINLRTTRSIGLKQCHGRWSGVLTR